MTAGLWIFVLIMGTFGVGLIIAGLRGWRDRPLGASIGWFAGGVFFLLSPAAATGSMFLVGALALVLFGCLPAIAWGNDLRQGVERRQHKKLALAAGMEPDEAARKYRRAPRAPWAIVVNYALLALLWVVTLILASAALNEPGLARAPEWELQWGEGPPLKLSWWLMGMVALVAAGLVHAAINSVRPLLARR